jgi:hypothetical protein
LQSTALIKEWSSWLSICAIYSSDKRKTIGGKDKHISGYLACGADVAAIAGLLKWYAIRGLHACTYMPVKWTCNQGVVFILSDER